VPLIFEWCSAAPSVDGHELLAATTKNRNREHSQKNVIDSNDCRCPWGNPKRKRHVQEDFQAFRRGRRRALASTSQVQIPFSQLNTIMIRCRASSNQGRGTRSHDAIRRRRCCHPDCYMAKATIGPSNRVIGSYATGRGRVPASCQYWQAPDNLVDTGGGHGPGEIGRCGQTAIAQLRIRKVGPRFTYAPPLRQSRLL